MEIKLEHSINGDSRIGLVLAGGGGKGAYQIGCWKAIHELGIQLSAVSGTSVGALNAALIAEGDINKGEELWANISRHKVFKTPFRGLPSFLIRLALVFGLSYFSRSSWSRFKLRCYRTAIGAFKMGVGLFILLALAMISGFHASWRGLLWIAGLTLLGYPLISMLILALPHLGWFICEKYDLFILENTPLKNTISSSLDTRLVSLSSIPVFITIAKPTEVFDPLLPSFERSEDSYNPLTPVERQSVFVPCFKKVYVPIYASLNNRASEEITDLLLRSASLPFGIFPNMPSKAEGWLDGGLADNIPVQPLIDYGCETIIVVSLDKESKDESWLVDKIWNVRTLRLLEKESRRYFDLFVNKYGKGLRLKAGSQNNWYHPTEGFLMSRFIKHSGVNPVLSPLIFEFPEVWEERSTPMKGPLPRMLHISPSKNLGGLIRGTLNFSAKKARRLIKMGYEDTMKSLNYDRRDVSS